MRFAFSMSALAAAFSVCLAASAVAQESQAAAASGGALGKPPAARSNATPAITNIGAVNATLRYSNASFGTGAVGLRNRGEGGFNVSGVTLPIKSAFLYWAVITQGAPTAAHSNVYLRKTGSWLNIAGSAIGSGASPCWAGDRTTVYRGVVPISLANGNGHYTILLRLGANADTSGASPWVSSTPPMVEGASLVIVGTGTATVSIYDVGFAGRMFFDTLTYQLNSAVSVANAVEVLFHNIGADGQIGVGVAASISTSIEPTFLNGRRIAGLSSPANDSDWNGGVAGPLPQLWDNTTHNVTFQARAGAAPNVLPFIVAAPDDCLVTVANVVSVR